MTREVVAEELAPEATSAGRARALLRRALAGHEREDDLDPAQLAMSEIVTNALVHAGTPMSLRILLAPHGLRVELSDGSQRMPTRREFGDAAATGRGLHLVEELTSRWGAYPDGQGKVVWFELGDGEQVWDLAEGDDANDASVVVVDLVHMPLLMHHAWQEHAANLLRELLLVRLDADLSAIEEHASASDALGLLAQQVPAPDVGLVPSTVMSRATGPGISAPNVQLLVPRTSVPNFAALDVMLDEALRLAEQGELMWPPTQPEIQAMRRWICDQVGSQAAGEPSVAWSSYFTPPRRSPDHPEVDWDTSEVRDSAEAVLAADDANRILAISRAAVDLLGFDEPGELVGQRLMSIIPERFHQAHIAGFTLHLVKGRRPLIGRRVTVPARRRDGSEVVVDLRVDVERLPSGRSVFIGRFFC
ncbi:ATP-binding protein [Nocardioides sp.]|uniref:ATP-binding protein n=1 Tax=Nocardioides sp. TaxID=35761 RepID=UPI002ED4F30A